jgi:NAD(P)-dependent dehydrogenase (short-subunit alcohol dehydrogenase family)
MAEALARAGAAVVIGDIQEEPGKATAEALRESGATAGFVSLDVTEDANWESAVAQTIAELGGLDIVVNNAGVEISGLVVDLDPADVRRMLEVNVLGTALGVKHAFRAMRPGGPAGGGGAVSRPGRPLLPRPYPGQPSRPPAPVPRPHDRTPGIRRADTGRSPALRRRRGRLHRDVPSAPRQ